MSDFRPLMAPSVGARTPEEEAPVAWYEVIAPRFAAPTGTAEPALAGESGGAQPSWLGDIDLVAEQEQVRRLAGEAEPAAIRKIRANATEEARRIVAEARDEARKIAKDSRDEAFKLGYGAGYAAGAREAERHEKQRADDEREVRRRELAEFVEHIEDASRRAWLDMESEIIGLVLEIARKVIKMEVEINRAAALEIVKNTLRRVADSTSLRVRVHADDLETVRANREDLYSLVDTIRKVEIVEDRRVGPGGCILETDAGTIDARIETQMEEIRRLLGGDQPGTA